MDKIESLLQDKRRLYLINFVAGIFVLASLAFILYRVGTQGGETRADSDFQTRIAQLPAAEKTAQLAVVAEGAASAATDAATLADTATPTPSPTDRPTPTQTSTPASVAEWTERFRTRATDGLNALIGSDFTADRAEPLLRRLAQDHGMVFVLASYFELDANGWAALVVPRTQEGETLPILFWRDPNDQNRVRSQLLQTRLVESAQNGNSLGGDEDVRTQFQFGVSSGLLRADSQGRFQLLLIENPTVEDPRVKNHTADSALSILVLGQPTPAADFDLLWWSQRDDQWPIQGEGSRYELVEDDDSLLPLIDIVAALVPNASLRDTLDAPTLFLEKPPFAQQRTRTLWRPDFAKSLASRRAASGGYRLASSELLLTPLTTFSRFLKLLQDENLIAAGDHTTRLDLLQQAFDLELTEPALWLGFYLDGEGEPLFDGRVTETLRFFDNGDRSRTFNAVFLREEGEPYRLASLQTLLSVYEAEDLVTPVGGSPGLALNATPRPTVSETIAESGNAPDRLTTETDTASAPITVRSMALTATASAATEPATESATASTPEPTQIELDLTPTGIAAETETATPTATPTETTTPPSTETPTGTPTLIGLPAALPDIPPSEPGLVTGSIASSLSNLRGGPDTEYVRVAQLDLGDPVEYFGIADTGDWLLLRANKPGSPNDGAVGWISITLVYWNSDIGQLPRYFRNGLPVVPFTPAPTATPTETPDPTIPTAVPTPTQRATSEIRQPEPQSTGPQSTGRSSDAPLPEADELSVFVSGDAIPARSGGIVDITIVDGQSARLDVQTATIEIWSGLFGQEPGEWVLAPAELLWGGAELTVRARASSNDLSLLVASRVRIVRPPVQERSELLYFPSLAESVASDEVMGLLGGREEQGVYLLTATGTLQQILVNEQDAAWVGGDEFAGMLLQSPPSPTGLNRFSWVRADGTGLLISAQPFHNISGVAGDGFRGIWWIETPQADFDQWELWHYDPAAASIELRLRSTGAILRRAENVGAVPVRDSVVPLLLSARPSIDGQLLSLTLDSVDRAQQQLYTGLFALELGGAAEGVEPAEQLNLLSARLLLPGASYRGPLKVNPAQTELAYFVYDADHPSLTSGFITPANRLNLLTLSGAGEGAIQTVYETQTSAEFLAPQITWRDNSQLVVARSRFDDENIFSSELFGLVEIRLPEKSPVGAATDANVAIVEASGDVPADAPIWNTHLLPDGQQILDFTACRDGLYTLLIMQDAAGNLQVGRWGGEGRPRPLFGLPLELQRAFICWRAPAPAQ